MNIGYSAYKKVNGDGPNWLCEVRENGKSRLVFSGDDIGEAIDSAREWVNKSFDTPERRAKMADLAQKRGAAKSKKKDDA